MFFWVLAGVKGSTRTRVGISYGEERREGGTDAIEVAAAGETDTAAGAVGLFVDCGRVAATGVAIGMVGAGWWVK
jgi:hypothetical protein